MTAARDLTQNILSQRRDHVALLTRLVQKQDELMDSAEDMESIELFSKSQRVVFDDVRRQMDRLKKERDYFAADTEAPEVFRTIFAILAMPKPYRRIGELPELVSKIRKKYDAMLDIKRDEVAEAVRQGMQDVHQLAGEARGAGTLLKQADDWFAKKREALKTAASLTDLDAMITQTLNYKDNICHRMEMLVAPVPPVEPNGGENPPPKIGKIATVRRYDLYSVFSCQGVCGGFYFLPIDSTHYLSYGVEGCASLRFLHTLITKRLSRNDFWKVSL